MSNSKNTFEESLKKLEKIVEKLEDGNVNLDDSIKSFEEGVALVKECQKQLSEFEKSRFKHFSRMAMLNQQKLPNN